jgi:hypothetical protein
MTPRFRILLIISLAATTMTANAQDLPDPTSEKFCQAVQHILANTEVESINTIFTEMPEYRHSKPSPDPLMIYQVVTYDGQRPIMVSCKVKGAAHIRATYGKDAAGEQLYCPEIARRIKAQAITELHQENLLGVALAAGSFVIDENEPYMTGQDYLSDFELSYVGEDGAIHFQSPGLFHDYDSWTTWILPADFEGQSYCHLATVEYMKAVAKGEIKPGTMMTTADDAPVTPQ